MTEETLEKAAHTRYEIHRINDALEDIEKARVDGDRMDIDRLFYAIRNADSERITSMLKEMRLAIIEDLNNKKAELQKEFDAL